MLSKKKKIFVLVGMVALLVLTGCLNIFLNNGAAKTGGDGGDGGTQTYDMFATYRKDRQDTRNQTILYLDAIIASDASTEEAKTNARASKDAIMANMELELVVEGLIKALGFQDAFITNSTENVNIIVKQEVLTEVEANRILDVVVRETGRDATTVIIMPIK